MWKHVLLGLVLSLITTLASASQITISWSDNSSTEDSFHIERKLGLQGTYTDIQTTVADVEVFADTDLLNGKLYCYRVRAHNSAGFSPYTNQACNIARIFGPDITLTTPLDNAQVFGTINLQATASSTSSTIAGVQFFINGLAFGPEDLTSPYAISWNTNTAPDGFYTISAVARDAAGNTNVSIPAHVTVNNFATPPPTTGKVVAYSFDSGVSPVADASGNGFTGTVFQAYWVPGQFSLALQFDGQASNVLSTLMVGSQISTYSIYTYRMGPGGNNLGRIFSKSSANAEIELLSNDDANGVYKYIRAWSGGVGIWTFVQPGINHWHHIGLVYDASLATNKPTIYVDGVGVFVTTVQNPSGTLLTNTDPYILGNSASGDRGWLGLLDNFYKYNTALTQAQVQATMNTGVQ